MGVVFFIGGSNLERIHTLSWVYFLQVSHLYGGLFNGRTDPSAAMHALLPHALHR